MKVIGGQFATESGDLLSQAEILVPENIAFIRETFGIKISRLPLNLAVSVSLKDSRAELVILGEIGQKSFAISQNQQGLVVDDSWHPIRPGDMVEMDKWLGSLGLKTGACSFADSMKLRSHVGDTPFPVSFRVLDETHPENIFFNLHNVTPYPYQIEGIQYLQNMSKTGVGCVLADEMGLGKTLQVIAYLAGAKDEDNKPALVVAPATLLENWRRELAKFAPQLRVMVRKSGSRSFELNQFDEFDVVVTSYDTMTADIGLLSRVSWSTIVLDEAQYVKNPTARRTSYAKRIPRKYAIAITGTPFENHLSDTWSLVDFVFPGYLGSLRDFNALYSESVSDAEQLSWVIEPLILRRLVADVAADLPERIDIPVFLEPTSEMLTAQSILLGEARKPGGSLLAQIQNLRTLSSHANKNDGSFETSPKFTYLRDLLWEVISSGEKALVFTSFNLTAERLATWLLAGWPDVYINSINGSTPVDDRQKIVDTFTEVGRGVLILNPQAAGVGLNITAANHVVHFNPEWNPALTEQASKRAHRNGQTRPVTVHYLFYTQTIEELVASSQDLKRAIGKALVPGVLLPLSEGEVIERLLNWGTR